MKNLWRIIFLFASFSPFCFAMVRNVLIKNESGKKYALKSGDELHNKGQVLVPLHWSYNESKTRADANIEFFDTTDSYYAECKKHGLCSFILYCHISKLDKQKNFEAKLERKRPHVSIVKDFLKEDICGLQTLKLIVHENLESADLKIED